MTTRNLVFLRSSLPASLRASLLVGTSVSPGSHLHRSATAAFKDRRDRVPARPRLHTPADGHLYKQFDRRTGLPAAAGGSAWSHSAFLTAVFDRGALMSSAR